VLEGGTNRVLQEPRAIRQERCRPIADVLYSRLTAQLERFSGKRAFAEAIRYALRDWQGLVKRRALRWTWLVLPPFQDDAVRPQPLELAYNLANVLRSLMLPRTWRNGRWACCARSWSRSAPGSCGTDAT
jgi:hypothetical protein